VSREGRGPGGFLLWRRSFSAAPGVGQGAPLDEADSQPVAGLAIGASGTMRTSFWSRLCLTKEAAIEAPTLQWRGACLKRDSY